MPNDEQFDELNFIASVIRKNRLRIVIPSIEDEQSYVRCIIENFKSRKPARTLVAMSLTALLMQKCIMKESYEQLLMLAEKFEPIIRSHGEIVDVEIAGQELRSALFWSYLRAGVSDPRLLIAESRIMAALCGCSPEMVRRADAALTQGWKHGE